MTQQKKKTFIAKPFGFEETKFLKSLLRKCGYKNVLMAIVGQADLMKSVSGVELAGQLDNWIGNFGYFPVCSLEGEGGVGHDAKGMCNECGAES